MDAGLKPYAAMKDSGVPWLGEMPGHWRTERAKWLFRKMDRPVREFDEVVTCFRDGTVTLRKNRRVSGFTESLKEIGYQGIRRGDLVIHAMDAFAGAIGVADADGKGTPVYSVCEPQPMADSHYYAYAIREMARSQWIQALAKGIRERSTDFRFERFASQAMPAPPLHEQAAIVRFLDSADRRIRRYIRAKQKLIRLLEEQKRGIIHRAVTRGLDCNVRLKPSGVEWLGNVPGHWEIMPLRRLARAWCDGPFGSGLKSEHYCDQGIRVVRLQNIGHAEFRHSAPAFISAVHYSTLGDHDVEHGDLLVAGLGDERRPAGRACVAPASIIPAMVKADCFRFRLQQDRLHPEFAALHLSATAVDASASLSTGATRQRTNLQSTASRAIAVPPLDEQRTIVRHIERETLTCVRGIHIAESEVVLLREYRTRLTADVVTGKLDVREAAAKIPSEASESEPIDDVAIPADGDDPAEDADLEAAET